MINGITSSNLDTYIEYLKNENQTAETADLSFSLEEYLEAADAESCIQISESTLKDSDKDFLKKNADKLANFGVSQDQIQNIIGDSESKENVNKTETSGTEVVGAATSDLSAAISRTNAMKTKNNKFTTNLNKLAKKNAQQNALAQTNYAKVQKENNALKEYYETLKANVSAQEDLKEKEMNQAAIAYEKQMVGKMDVAEASKTEKYQEIEKNTVDVQTTNAFSKGFKADSDSHFRSVSTNLNYASAKLDNSSAYTQAGAIMHSTSFEIMDNGEFVADYGISSAEAASQMMNSTDVATKNKGQAMYNDAMNLINDGIGSMQIGQDDAVLSQKYYNTAVKDVNAGNIFVTQTSASVSSIVSNNNSLTAKIYELQSKEV